jgi:hypothetical protein
MRHERRLPAGGRPQVPRVGPTHPHLHPHSAPAPQHATARPPRPLMARSCPERPRRHPPPLSLQRRARCLPRAPHTGWPRATTQPPIPTCQRHGRGHCPSVGSIHHATITVQHLFPLTSGSGAPVQPPELWVEATTWWERTDGRPPARPSLLYAPASASSVQRSSAALRASPATPLERCPRVDGVRPHLHCV